MPRQRPLCPSHIACGAPWRDASRMKLAELHVHLEGTVRYETALELAAVNGLPTPPPYRYSDLPGFFDIYFPVARSMVTAADFERVILEHAEALRAQGIGYGEIRRNPAPREG